MNHDFDDDATLTDKFYCIAFSGHSIEERFEDLTDLCLALARKVEHLEGEDK